MRTRIIITDEGKVIIEGIGYVGDECIIDLNAIVQKLRDLGIEVNIEETKRKEEAMANEQRVHTGTS